MSAIHISIAAEPLLNIYGFAVTNSLVTTWVFIAILILVALYSKLFGTPKVIIQETLTNKVK